MNSTATTPDIRQAPRPNADDLLSRAIGVRQLAATIFNYTVGSGIFVLPAFAAARLGSAAILAYIVCSVIMGLMVVCFAEAGSRVSTTGGAYAYIDAALGPFVGFLGGVLLLFVDLTATAAVATIFAQSLLALLDAPSSRVVVMATAGLAMAAVAAINIAGIKRGVAVRRGSTLGYVGHSGDASATHLHFGVSWPTPRGTWWVRRGEVWPWRFLDAWRSGHVHRTPVVAVHAERAKAGRTVPRCRVDC